MDEQLGNFRFGQIGNSIPWLLATYFGRKVMGPLSLLFGINFVLDMAMSHLFGCMDCPPPRSHFAFFGDFGTFQNPRRRQNAAQKLNTATFWHSRAAKSCKKVVLKGGSKNTIRFVAQLVRKARVFDTFLPF